MRKGALKSHVRYRAYSAWVKKRKQSSSAQQGKPAKARLGEEIIVS